MKEKEIKIFAGVFVALLVIFFITKPRHTTVNIDELVQTILVGVAKEDVASIEVYKEIGPDKSAQMNFVRVDKEKDKWVIPTTFSAKAQKSRIDKLLGDLIDMTGKVRSSDPKHHENYQISDAKGIHLLLKDESGKPLANLIIGKKSEDTDGGFVRFADRDKVYFADKNLLSDLSVNGDIDTLTHFKPRPFIDLKAIDQDKDQIQEIALAKNGVHRYLRRMEREVTEQKNDTTTTTKKEIYWVFSKGNREVEMDKKEMESFLRDVTSVYATEVTDRMGNTLADLNKPANYGLNLNNPGNYLIFKTQDGAQRNFIFGKEMGKDKNSFLYVQDDNLIYQVSKYNCDKILKWVDEIPNKVKKK